MNNPIQTLKRLATLQLLMGAAVSLAAKFIGDNLLGASTAIGALLMWFNLIFLGWSWWRILSKKSIAWSVAIIVIKYAVLLGSVFFLAKTSWFSLLGAGLGIASFLLAVLALPICYRDIYSEQEDGNSKIA